MVVGRAQNPDSSEAQPRTAWALAGYCFLVHGAESERYLCLGTWTAEICTELLANVLEQEVVAVLQDKTCPSKKLTFTTRELFFARSHPPCFFFFLNRAYHDSRRGRFQRAHPLSGVGSSLGASEGLGVGVTDLAPVVNQSQ